MFKYYWQLSLWLWGDHFFYISSCYLKYNWPLVYCRFNDRIQSHIFRSTPLLIAAKGCWRYYPPLSLVIPRVSSRFWEGEHEDLPSTDCQPNPKRQTIPGSNARGPARLLGLPLWKVQKSSDSLSVTNGGCSQGLRLRKYWGDGQSKRGALACVSQEWRNTNQDQISQQPNGRKDVCSERYNH